MILSWQSLFMLHSKETPIVTTTHYPYLSPSSLYRLNGKPKLSEEHGVQKKVTLKENLINTHSIMYSVSLLGYLLEVIKKAKK